MEYTLSQVWSILSEGSDDPDEVVDVQTGLARVRPSYRAFLLALAVGYSAAEAQAMADENKAEGEKVIKNGTRLKELALRELVEKIG